MATLVDGLDVASGGELRVALDSGMDPAEISFAGPGKSLAELETAVAAGITINLESATELERVAAIATRSGTLPHVAVRVNPDFELKTSGMKMSGGPKAFGIDAERTGRASPHRRTGIAFSAVSTSSRGSQNLRPEAIVEAGASPSNWRFALPRLRPVRSNCSTSAAASALPIPGRADARSHAHRRSSAARLPGANACRRRKS